MLAASPTYSPISALVGVSIKKSIEESILNFCVTLQSFVSPWPPEVYVFRRLQF